MRLLFKEGTLIFFGLTGISVPYNNGICMVVLLEAA